MGRKIASVILIIGLLTGVLCGCGKTDDKVKIGVSFGVGTAARWVNEKQYMEERAAQVGADIEVRLNTTDEPKTQKEDCYELIDSGIDVLILTPRDVYSTKEILDYARKNNVKVISYARVVWGEEVDLFVGYDSKQVGKKMGQYLTELVYEGDYIILSGDAADLNAALIYEGAMPQIESIKDNINIILDAEVQNWDPETAKKLVKEAVAANSNHVDAIFAPNDKLAGAGREALDELGITAPVAITGMDAELEALKRIIAGTQSSTIHMNLRELSNTAIDEAYHMAKKEVVNVNAEFNNGMEKPIDANLITGQLITKENLDRILIDSGYIAREEIYSNEIAD